MFVFERFCFFLIMNAFVYQFQQQLLTQKRSFFIIKEKKRGIEI